LISWGLRGRHDNIGSSRVRLDPTLRIFEIGVKQNHSNLNSVLKPLWGFLIQDTSDHMMPRYERWGSLPPEIYLLIADALQNLEDETTKGGFAVLNLALSSRALCGLLTRWAKKSPIARADAISLKYIGASVPGVLPWEKGETQRSALSIICKRIAGLCAICRNRMDNIEFFTGLQLCSTCDAFRVPKISYGRLNQLYIATELGLKKTTSTVSRFSPRFLRDTCRFFFPNLAQGIGANNERSRSHPVLLWEDVKALLNRKYLVDRHPGLNPEEPFYRGEDFGLFSEEPIYRTEFEWQQYSIWNQACVRWQNTLRGDRRWKISPTCAEMILLREFRYRFDPRWYPQTSLETEFKEYFRIAKVWVSYWEKRPWRPRNFPLQPRYRLQKGKWNWTNLQQFHLLCQKIRAMLTVYPDILQHPTLWLSCISNRLNCQACNFLEREYEEKNIVNNSTGPRKFFLSRVKWHGDVKRRYLANEGETDSLVEVGAGVLVDLVVVNGDDYTFQSVKTYEEQIS
jgi:hypothetical protein